MIERIWVWRLIDRGNQKERKELERGEKDKRIKKNSPLP